MRIASAERFAFQEALRHMKRNLDEGGMCRNPFHRVYKYADALYKAAAGDLYGVQKFDVLICGPDRLLNVILAYRAAIEGKSVAIYHGDASSWDGYESLLSERVKYFHPSFSTLIEIQLNLVVGVSLVDVISSLALAIDDQVGSDGESLVFQLDGCRIFQDLQSGQDECVRFWVEPGDSLHSYPTIERLLFWDQEQARRFAIDNGKFPEHSLEAHEVWMTGIASKEIGNIDSTRLKVFGEAARPLLGFEYFKGQDRLVDLAQALGAVQ